MSVKYRFFIMLCALPFLIHFIGKDPELQGKMETTILEIEAISKGFVDYSWKEKLSSYVSLENHMFIVENYDFYVFAVFYFIQKNLIYSRSRIIILPYALLFQIFLDIEFN